SARRPAVRAVRWAKSSGPLQGGELAAGQNDFLGAHVSLRVRGLEKNRVLSHGQPVHRDPVLLRQGIGDAVHWSRSRPAKSIQGILLSADGAEVVRALDLHRGSGSFLAGGRAGSRRGVARARTRAAVL